MGTLPLGFYVAAIIGGRSHDRFLRTASLHPASVPCESIHGHMTDETPRLTMVHFWANDDAVKLARALGAALDKTKTKRAPVR